ncbi:hypothetical protein [Agromyces archimandritae]|uniref:Uncharacterized protein n=1 Tax=Agromyces archimandritae TaxID=2781962 RepID=A0A975IN98_9MICO|nr:hypothetical protein [Agromyces archimandritae]QTX04340.1 hypothetical protein G127AT_13850 [Agromyces archimandritae]
MFRRLLRRKAAAQAAAPAPAHAPLADLNGEQVFEQLYARLVRFIGPDGDWSLVRRSGEDTDRIFQAMLTHQIAADLTRAMLAERDAVVAPAGAEPIAMSWNPAPLVVWAEPVDAGAALDTGIAALTEGAEAAEAAELADEQDALAA